MKLRLSDKQKHIIIGVGVVVAIATIIIPPLFKNANMQLHEHLNFSVKLPPKPSVTTAIAPTQSEVFQSVKIAQVNLTEPKKKQTIVLANPLEKKRPSQLAKQPHHLTKKNIKHPQYVLQVASFSNKNNAEALVHKLKNQQYKAFIKTHPTKKNIFYQVFIGTFKSKSKAMDINQMIAQNFHLKGFVTTDGVNL